MPIPYRPQQSPIDLLRAENVYAEYPADYLQLLWPRQTQGYLDGEGEAAKYVFVNLPADVGLRLRGEFFPLVEMHFHFPSEHRLDGREAVAELHIVHKVTGACPQEDEYVVLGVFLVEQEKDQAAHAEQVEKFFRGLARRAEAKARGGESAAAPPHDLDPAILLPPNRDEFFRYQGSLTTKLYEDNVETVRWVIYRQPRGLTRQALADFRTIAHRAKELQCPNRRFVLRNFAPESSGLAPA